MNPFARGSSFPLHTTVFIFIMMTLMRMVANNALYMELWRLLAYYPIDGITINPIGGIMIQNYDGGICDMYFALQWPNSALL